MSYKIITAAVMAATMATPSLAQSLNGASISGNVNVFTDDSYDPTNIALKAGAEFGLSGAFAIGANVGVYDSDEVDGTLTNVTLHGLYMVSPNTALGLYVSSDDEDGINYEQVGLEVGYGTPGGRFELYFGAVDGFTTDSSIDTRLAGITFEFEVARNFDLMFNSHAVTLYDDADDSVSIGTTAIGGRYTFDNGPSVYAEFGQVSTSAEFDGDTFVSTDNPSYFAVGAEYTFGRANGNLVSNRSVFEALGF